MINGADKTLEVASPRRRRWQRWIGGGDPVLLIAIAVGALARLWAIDFGLPGTGSRPDESIMVTIGLRMASGDLNPHFFRYPTLCPSLLAVLYALYYGAGRLMGSFHDYQDFLLQDSAPLYLIDRCLSAAFGIATIPLVYVLARRLFDRQVARIAALYLALAFIHVRDSHFGVSDITLVSFLTMSLLALEGCGGDARWRPYLGVGLSAGLAASTKYVGFLMLPVLALVHLYGARGRLRSLWDPRLLAAGLVCVVVFLLGTPFAVLDAPSFIQDVRYESAHLRWGHGVDLGRGWWRHPTFSLWYGLGPPLLLTAIAGAALLSIRSSRRALVLLAFPALYFALAGSGRTVFLRYALPMVPSLVIAAAWLTVGASRVAGRGSAVRQRLVMAGIAAVVISPSALSVLRFDLLLGERDNRLVAADWITAHVAPGTAIGQIRGFGGVPVRDGLRTLQARLRQVTGAAQYDVLRRGVLAARIDTLRRSGPRGYERYSWNPDEGRFELLGESVEDLPEIVVVFVSPLHFYDAPSPELPASLRGSYALETALLAVGPSARREWYDQQDAFHVPFSAFGGVIRPGPDIYIYRRQR